MQSLNNSLRSPQRWCLDFRERVFRRIHETSLMSSYALTQRDEVYSIHSTDPGRKTTYRVDLPGRTDTNSVLYDRRRPCTITVPRYSQVPAGCGRPDDLTTGSQREPGGARDSGAQGQGELFEWMPGYNMKRPNKGWALTVNDYPNHDVALPGAGWDPYVYRVGP